MTTTIHTEHAAPVTTGADYFETIYESAQGDPVRLPWVRHGPCPAFVNWLNAVAPSIVRCGARVAVAGCGLGFDAREAMRRGYEVTAFDCSRTAVAWARRLDPEHAPAYVQADLFNLPARWTHRFDLVAEIDNLESLPPHVHAEATDALARLMTPRGHLLVIGRTGDDGVAAEHGPPWPLAEGELLQAASAASLVAETVSTFEDDQGVPRVRALFRRG